VSTLPPEGLLAVPWSFSVVLLLGFASILGLVIALARSSTAAFEFDRNCAAVRRPEPAVAAAPAGRVATAPAPAPAPTVGAGPTSPGPTGAAAHPAGRALAAAREATWWLVDDESDGRTPEIVAGPFPDRIDAEWAALTTGLAASVRPSFGVLRPDGTLARREPASERTWLVALGLQLARLPEDWDEFLTDADELGTLVVEVGAALLEAGLPLYDCAALGPEDGDPTGGVCLVPDPASGGILVSWRAHDRMAVQQVRGAAIGAAVQQAMTAAVGEVLERLGFDVQPLPTGAGHLVSLDRF
jgi:hypothetical protein